MNTEVLNDLIDYNSKINNKDSLDYLNFEYIKSYGITNLTSTEMAFHPIQGILAIGNSNGDIKM